MFVIICIVLIVLAFLGPYVAYKIQKETEIGIDILHDFTKMDMLMLKGYHHFEVFKKRVNQYYNHPPQIQIIKFSEKNDIAPNWSAQMNTVQDMEIIITCKSKENKEKQIFGYPYNNDNRNKAIEFLSYINEKKMANN